MSVELRAGGLDRYQSLVMELLLIQACTVLVVAALWLLQGSLSAVSALIGGFIALVVNSCFAWRLFRRMHERSLGQIMLTLYGGEVLKIIACALCVVLVIRFLPVSVVPLLTGLAGTYIIYAPVAIYKQLRMVKVW